jgi:hypothetical protein
LQKWMLRVTQFRFLRTHLSLTDAFPEPARELNVIGAGSWPRDPLSKNPEKFPGVVNIAQ